MKRQFIIIGLVVIICSLFAGGAEANILNWRVYETEEFVVFFPAGYQWQAEEVLYFLDQHRDSTREATGNHNQLKTTVVIQDTGYSSGYADPRRSKIAIFTTRPSTVLEFSGYQNRLREISIHELTHLDQLLNHTRLNKQLTSLLGATFSPNVHAPLWVIEGIAVYNSSQISPYEGMLNEGYYDALVASKAQAGRLPSISAAAYEYNHFRARQWYIYGGVFIRYLAEQYGEKKLGQLFTEYGTYYWAFAVGDLFPGLALDQAAEKIYGKSLPQLYEEWRGYERRQHQNWQIDGKPVIETGGGRIYSLTAAGGKLYYFKEKRFDFTPLGKVEAGNHQRIKVVEYNPATGREKYITSLNWLGSKQLEVADDKLYYTKGEYITGFSNVKESGAGKIENLYSYDLTTGVERRLVREQIIDFTVIEDRIIYCRPAERKSGTEIWSYRQGKKKKLGQVKQIIGDLESNKNRLLVVSKKKFGSWNISRLNLDNFQVIPLINTPYLEKLPKAAGEQIYFTANYGGEYAVYQYNLGTEEVKRLTGGSYAKDGLVLEDQLYFVALTPEGETIHQTQIDAHNFSLPPQEEITTPDIKLPPETEQPGVITRNLSYLLAPQFTEVPYLLPLQEKRLTISGEDGIGFTNYQLSYVDFSDLQFQFATSLMRPLYLSLQIDKIKTSQQTSQLEIEYEPIYDQLDLGLTHFSLDYGLNYNFQNGLQGGDRLDFRSQVYYPQVVNRPEFELKQRGVINTKQGIAASDWKLGSSYYYDQNNFSSLLDLNTEMELDSEWQVTDSALDLNWVNHYQQQQGVVEAEIKEQIDWQAAGKSQAAETGLELSYPLVNDPLPADLQLKYNNYQQDRKVFSTDSNRFKTGLEVGSYPAAATIYADELQASEKNAVGIEYNYKRQDNSFKLIEEYRSVYSSFSSSRKLITELKTDWLKRKYRLTGQMQFEFATEEKEETESSQVIYTLDSKYKHKLLKIRKGFWNPNIFAGDLYGQGVIHYKDGVSLAGEEEIVEKEWEVGYELALEMGVGFHYTLVPRLGIKRTHQGTDTYFKINIETILSMI